MRTRADTPGRALRAERGSKMWITNGPDAEVLVVYAKDRPGRRQPRHHRLPRREGACPASLRPRSSTSSACAGPTPASWCSRTARCRRRNVIGEVGGGVRVLMSGLDYERAVLAAGPLGIMRACMDIVLPYVHQRQQFRPAHRHLPAHAGQARRHVHDDETRHAPTSTPWRRPATGGETSRKDAAGAILFAAEKATWMALEAIQALGGNGYVNEFATGRLLARRQALRDRRRQPARSAACSSAASSSRRRRSGLC